MKKSRIEEEEQKRLSKNSSRNVGLTAIHLTVSRWDKTVRYDFVNARKESFLTVLVGLFKPTPLGCLLCCSCVCCCSSWGGTSFGLPGPLLFSFPGQTWPGLVSHLCSHHSQVDSAHLEFADPAAVQILELLGPFTSAFSSNTAFCV